MATTQYRRSRRSQCFWEPIYDPDLVGKLKRRGWDFSADAGPVRSYFDLSDLQPFIDKGGSRIFKNVRFRDCDFQGISSNTSQVVFDKCDFINCDLSLSTFVNFKFSKCLFERSSFGQTIFRKVEFRDCNWNQIAASSNETVLEHVFISNPAAFIRSLWTQLNKAFLKERNKKVLYQWHRHELNKATIARMVLNNHRLEGDDRTFYESVRVFETQQAFSKSCRAIYNAQTRWFNVPWHALVAIFWIFELALLWVFGILNAWGASTLRPFLAVFLVFFSGGLYYLYFWKNVVEFPFQISFDVTSVAGYTKAMTADTPPALQIAGSVHLSLSLVLYSVFFATIVARLSRVR